MEKKQYIKPELMVEEFETIEMMMVASKLQDEGGIEDSLSNGRDGRRGQWGNLWSTED